MASHLKSPCPPPSPLKLSLQSSNTSPSIGIDRSPDPDGLFIFIKNYFTTNRTDINLSSKDLKKISKNIIELLSNYSLKTLNLHNNLLIDLPENFGQLSQLRYLNLHGNNLSIFPKSVRL